MAEVGTIEGEKLNELRDLAMAVFREAPVVSILGPLDNEAVMTNYRQIVDKDHLRITFDPPLNVNVSGEDVLMRELAFGLTTFGVPTDLPRTPYTIVAVTADRRLAHANVWRHSDAPEALGKAVTALVHPDAAAAKQPPPTGAAPVSDEATTRAGAAASAVDLEQLHRRLDDAARAMYEHLTRPGVERPSPELVCTWSKRLDAELGQPDWEKHLSRMRDRLAEEEALHATGAATHANVLAYRYFVAEAEMWSALQAEMRAFTGDALRGLPESLTASAPTTRQAR